MKITEIKLQNWCQYVEDHIFDLSSNGDANVILIHADNDVGKSSLFYSITWCFYEKQPEKWEKNGWPLYPITWLESAKNGEEIKTEVSITFEHAGSKYCAIRSFKAQKSRDDVVIVNNDFVFMRQEVNGNWVNDEEKVLHSILPRSILGYFIFDAETIEHFVNQSDHVQDSVRRLLDIEDAERVIQHLAIVEDDLMREFKRKKSNQARVLGDEITILAEEVQSIKNSLVDEVKGFKAQLKQNIHEKNIVEDQLLKYATDYNLLEEQRRAEENIDKFTLNIVDNYKKIRNLTQNLYLPLVYPIANKVFNFLEEKRRRGELPKDIKRRFVDERIKIKKCICGTALHEGSTEFKKISEFRNTLSDELSDLSQVMNNGLVSLQSKTKELKIRINEQLISLSQNKEDKEKEVKRLENIRSKIQGKKDIPDIPQLQNKKEGLENIIASLNKEIVRNEILLGEKEAFLQKKRDLLRIENEKEEAGGEAEEMWGLATIAQKALNEALDIYKSKARKYLEIQCNKACKELFWRENVYNIHINDDYVLTVKSDIYGELNLLPGMSMGATQVAGLSLITALAKQTRAKVPLIMDTPFARLSPAHITRALAECPKHFEQWILFLQPSEWRDQDYRKNIGKQNSERIYFDERQ